MDNKLSLKKTQEVVNSFNQLLKQDYPKNTPIDSILSTLVNNKDTKNIGKNNFTSESSIQLTPEDAKLLLNNPDVILMLQDLLKRNNVLTLNNNHNEIEDLTQLLIKELAINNTYQYDFKPNKPTPDLSFNNTNESEDPLISNIEDNVEDYELTLDIDRPQYKMETEVRVDESAVDALVKNAIEENNPNLNHSNQNEDLFEGNNKHLNQDDITNAYHLIEDLGVDPRNYFIYETEEGEAILLEKPKYLQKESNGIEAPMHLPNHKPTHHNRAPNINSIYSHQKPSKPKPR